MESACGERVLGGSPEAGNDHPLPPAASTGPTGGRAAHAHAGTGLPTQVHLQTHTHRRLRVHLHLRLRLYLKLRTYSHAHTLISTHTRTNGLRQSHTRHICSVWRTKRLYCFPQVGRGGAVSGIGLCRFYPCSALSPPVHAYHLPRVYTSSLVSYTHVSSIDPGLTIVPGPCPYQALRVSLRVAS